MFIHSKIVRMRVLAVALLLPTCYLFWLALEAMTKMFFVSIILIAVVAIMLYACWSFWNYVETSAEENQLPDPSKWAGPNRVDSKVRVGNIVASCALLGYGIHALIADDFFLPAKQSGGTHFTGLAAWLIFGSVCSIAIKLISEVIDHYDRRNNELRYADISAACNWFAWTFFVAALLQVFLQRQ